MADADESRDGETLIADHQNNERNCFEKNCEQIQKLDYILNRLLKRQQKQNHALRFVTSLDHFLFVCGL